MEETERSGLLTHRATSPIIPIVSVPNGKVDVKDVGVEDTSDASRQEKVQQLSVKFVVIYFRINRKPFHLVLV